MTEDAATKKAVKAALEQYNQAVVGEDARNAMQCMQELQELLNKYNCVLFPRCIISPQGLEFAVETIPKPPHMATGQGQKLMGYGAPPQGKKNASTPRQVSKKGKGRSGQKGKKG